MTEPAVPALSEPVWGPTESAVTAAVAGATRPIVAATSVAASSASRARVVAKPEKNLSVVSTMISLAR